MREAFFSGSHQVYFKRAISESRSNPSSSMRYYEAIVICHGRIVFVIIQPLIVIQKGPGFRWETGS